MEVPSSLWQWLQAEEPKANIIEGDYMKKSGLPMTYETPLDHEILKAYINKNISYKRADIRKIKRALRKLAY